MPRHGPLRESLVIEWNTPQDFSVTSLTRTASSATAITAVDHGYATGDYVTIAGATPSGYDGKVKIGSVLGPTSFTYPVNGTLATPATGTITVTYVSDAQGGRVTGWETFRTLAGELVPLAAWERLQAAAIENRLEYRFRIHSLDSAGVTPEMRVRWTPQFPPSQPTQTLDISGVIPDGDGRQFTFIECAGS
jgi:head-tail adaptor